MKKSRHIRIEIIKNKVSEQANYILEIVVIIISMGFCAFLVVKGSELVARIFSLKQISPALRLPMGYPYLSVPVGASLMIIRYIEKIIEITNEIRKLRLEGKVK